MTKQINLVRAIGSEFIGRKFKTLLIVSVIAALVIVIAALWLTTLNAWWWLLAVPVIILTVLGLFLLLVVRAIIKELRPDLSSSQSTAVANFVNKLERVAENLQKPMFIIVFHVARDIIRPHKKTFIQNVAEDSTTLHKDFVELQRNF